MFKEIRIPSSVHLILTGIVLGLTLLILQKFGNPANMGIDPSLFIRDIEGALRIHHVASARYLRPEIPAIILGAFITAILTKSFIPKESNFPISRFFFGFFAMIGALAFLGDPLRAFIRIGGGDLNGFTGILGLLAGIAVGSILIRRGFPVEDHSPKSTELSGAVPAMIAGLLLFVAIMFPWVFSSGGTKQSLTHAPLWLSLAGGVVVGAVVLKSGFCTVTPFRELFVHRKLNILTGIIACTLVLFVGNKLTGTFHSGYMLQPFSHYSFIANFMGLFLTGIACTLSGGDPLKQLTLAGSGNGNARSFVAGMIIAAAFSHIPLAQKAPDAISSATSKSCDCRAAIQLVSKTDHMEDARCITGGMNRIQFDFLVAGIVATVGIGIFLRRKNYSVPENLEAPSENS